MTIRTRNLLDQTAISLSLLCAIHCFAVPIALALLPSLAVVPLVDEHFHVLLAVLVVPTSFIALFLGCRMHQRWRVLGWGVPGVLILVFTALFGHDLLGEIGERAFTVFGAGLVTLGHLLNFKLCRETECSS